MSLPATTRSPAVIWHEVECGSYAADLPLWEELAREADGTVLELGCGSGRVALHLARRGFDVTALDRDRALLAELERRAAAARLAVECVAADARAFRLGRRFALVAAPMQLASLLGADGRVRMLEAAAGHLEPNGRLALSLLADLPHPPRPSTPPAPDVAEREGWVYSSLPLEVSRGDARIAVRRLRQIVSPAGDLTEEISTTHLDAVAPQTLEAEAEAAGLRRAGRRRVPATDEHLGSVVVLLEAA